MRRRWLCVPMMTLALLAACGGGEDSGALALSLRTRYLSMTGFSAQAEVTVDYGTRVYQYTALLSGDGEAGRMELITPESIAGLAVLWGEEGGGLEYDGAVLTTGALSPDGLSPADAMPLILRACQSGVLLDSCLEPSGEDSLLRVSFAGAGPDGAEGEVAVWARQEDLALARAEVSSGGQTVVRLDFTQFELQTSAPAGAETE